MSSIILLVFSLMSLHHAAAVADMDSMSKLASAGHLTTYEARDQSNLFSSSAVALTHFTIDDKTASGEIATLLPASTVRIVYTLDNWWTTRSILASPHPSLTKRYTFAFDLAEEIASGKRDGIAIFEFNLRCETEGGMVLIDNNNSRNYGVDIDCQTHDVVDDDDENDKVTVALEDAALEQAVDHDYICQVAQLEESCLDDPRQAIDLKENHPVVRLIEEPPVDLEDGRQVVADEEWCPIDLEYRRQVVALKQEWPVELEDGRQVAAQTEDRPIELEDGRQVVAQKEECPIVLEDGRRQVAAIKQEQPIKEYRRQAAALEEESPAELEGGRQDVAQKEDHPIELEDGRQIAGQKKDHPAVDVQEDRSHELEETRQAELEDHPATRTTAPIVGPEDNPGCFCLPGFMRRKKNAQDRS